MAQLLNIWTKPAKGEQMVSHESIECIMGEGLQGCVGGKANHRQVTILSLAAWNEAQQEIGEQMDPIYRRANLLVDDINFENTKGKNSHNWRSQNRTYGGNETVRTNGRTP